MPIKSLPTIESTGSISLLKDSSGYVCAGLDGVVHSINNSSGTAMQLFLLNKLEILGGSSQTNNN